MPIAGLAALLVLIVPVWLGSYFSKGDATPAKSVPASTPAVVAPAPVEAPVAPAPEPVAPPLQSTTSSNWEQYVDQHPMDVMADVSLMPRFLQTLGEDFESVKRAVSTASPTTLEAGYLMGSGNAPHSGGMDTAIWGIDTQSGQIYAVWKQGNQIKVYGTQYEQRLPASLYRWYKDMGGPN